MCFLTEEDLLCRSVWSERSAVKGLATATVRCRHGEEMLSCSSFSQNGARAGERVEVISKEFLFRLLKKKQKKNKLLTKVIFFLTGERWAEKVSCCQWEWRARCVRCSALLHRPQSSVPDVRESPERRGCRVSSRPPADR